MIESFIKDYLQMQKEIDVDTVKILAEGFNITEDTLSDDFIYFCQHGKYPKNEVDEMQTMYDIILIFDYLY